MISEVKCNPAAATSEDPFGEFEHITPVSVRTAAQLLRIAAEAKASINQEWIEAQLLVKALGKQRQAAITKHSEALHRLHISALQPNGGEE